MYQFKPSRGLLPVMPGDRLYSVTNFTLDDEPYYAEGVVVTEDSLQVIFFNASFSSACILQISCRASSSISLPA